MIKTLLLDFVPSPSIHLLVNLLDADNLSVKIKNERKTRHGDYRQLPNGKHQITVNSNLNPYRFLITLVHEVAHFEAYKTHGKTIKPHGKEWKQTFQHLMLPFLSPNIYPIEMLAPLAHYLKNPKASTDTDVKLSLALKENTAESGKSFIFELELNSVFVFKNKLYRKGNKRKTRYECLQLETNRSYLFNQNAEVILKED